MARLEDRLLNHPLREHLAALRGHVAELNEETVAAADEHSEGAVHRVPKALDYIEGVLAAADPALTTASALASIESALSNASSVASRLPDNPQFAETLDQHVEEALVAVGPVAAASPLLAERAGAAAGAFDTALTETVRSVTERARALSEELDALEERREEAATAQEAEETTRRQTFEATLDELSTRVDTEKGRVDQLVPTLQSQFESSQAAHTEAFETLREELKSAAVTAESELKEQAEQTATELHEQAEAVLAQVRARQDKVEELYGVITDTSTTGAFRDEAKAQKGTADTWRKVAVGFGIAAALFAIASIVLAAVFPDRASSVSAVVAKVTATLVAAGIAAYAGRQSGRHREREEEAKRLELELVAFPPFIESLDDAQKRDVRKQFADRAFRGRPEQTGGGGGGGLFRKNDSFGVATPELIEAVANALRRNDPPAP